MVDVESRGALSRPTNGGSNRKHRINVEPPGTSCRPSTGGTKVPNKGSVSTIGRSPSQSKLSRAENRPS